MDLTDVDALSLLQMKAEMRAPASQTKSSPKASPQRTGGGIHYSAQEAGFVRLLDFTKAEVVTNNLGGQGPGSGPEEIRYRNLVQGQSVDLVVTVAAGYEPHNSSKNGILGGNGQINAMSGETVPLTFSFVDEGTDTPFTMPKFYITFSDIDERHGGGEYETIKVDGYTKYYTNDDLKIVDDGLPVPTFASSDFGNFEDNKFNPNSPTPSQLSHAVTYLFIDKATFHATYRVVSKSDTHRGRNILFSGISQLVMCQDPSTYLLFANSTVTANNLGGKGPLSGPEELRYSNIGAYLGQELDLVVTADMDYGYKVSNASQNGRHGDFGHINLWCGETETNSEAYMTFTLVQTGTNTPVTVEQFAFVVFDFDSGLHEKQVEYVDLIPNQPGFEGGSGYSSYIVTETSEVAVLDGVAPNGKTRFKATKHGTESDNPATSQMLAREVSDKSVVFTFRRASHFTMTLGITPTGVDSGRNFMFSGQDMYLMCD